MASDHAEAAAAITPNWTASSTQRHRPGRVSVIIPTYNCARYLVDALRSVAMQSYDDLEIVVIDDGSTDQTREIVARCGVPCTYLMNGRHKGPAGARNHGICSSSGQYIAFLDADDAWLPSKLALQVAALQTDPRLLAIGSIMIPWDSTPSCIDQTTTLRRYSFAEMVVRNRLGTPTVVCRRDALRTVGLFDETMDISEDYELWLRLSRIGTVGRLETPLARFRQRSDGASAGNRDRTFDLDMRFTRSLPNRYADVPGIRRFVKQGLAAREFERAIELCDVEKRYGEALRATVNSIGNWPWPHPLGLGRPLARLRRVRRIVLDALSARYGVGA
ncbi:UDP-Glc:alpha-D-GlcNAc-diphosphoundecaprenol beta-1,3-glucosyltransferase WfgD [Stieleria neptunia]|uniref:UDP-Glc:alpha-D-GlcNAc-diphosphoundecaprenol beta-1,3-glucosyltransferase WfgD n=1 Tax=Stieleria neptunia TaxID=2527979 RepID=A0A518HJK4_9BACT|nr:glycosyltransferase [Stieleria neptunia]QDV40950.1 UDP-Glc:alpha-D-GlcNAc-diphosphoundecaprenol beta-1,3-glucosyltransferase WfgD [Stieleria neptunia]